ncbi:transposase [Methanofollis sp.]|uniref:transposase n=1 Tax=Methanofollis sp. TaxID=2052835 RepID=UPI003458BAE6
MKTWYGDTVLQKPQSREFPSETEVFGRYARVERALADTISESYLQDVSTRKIQGMISIKRSRGS